MPPPNKPLADDTPLLALSRRVAQLEESSMFGDRAHEDLKAEHADLRRRLDEILKRIAAIEAHLKE